MKNIRVFFLTENFQFLEVKFSIYLNRRIFVMVHQTKQPTPAHIHGKHGINNNNKIFHKTILDIIISSYVSQILFPI